MNGRPSKSPVLGALLSAVLPGLGQFYTRQWGKGLGFLLLFVVVSGTLMSAYDPQAIQQAAMKGRQHENLQLIVSLAMLGLGLAVWSAVDAFRIAAEPR